MTAANVLHRVTQQLSLRGSGDVETAFVLDVEHQITSIQVLHDKEEMLLCKRGQGGATSYEVICQVCSRQQSLWLPALTLDWKVE